LNRWQWLEILADQLTITMHYYQFFKVRLQMLSRSCRVQAADMAGVYKLEIAETEADLKQRLRSTKTASDKERLQLLGGASGCGWVGN
jgi:phytoene/squalene synthetase